jgi:amino acid adenylation domain-containing protein
VTQPKFTERLIEIAAKHPREREFWHKTLGDRPSMTVIPYDHPLANGERELEQSAFDIGGPVAQRLIAMSKGADHTIHALLLSGLAILLSRHSREQDILMGTSIYRQEGEPDFCNTALPLQIAVDTAATFRDLVLATRQTLQEALANYSYPIQILGRDLDCVDPEGNPLLFDVALQMETIQDPAFLSTVLPNLLFSVTRQGDRIGGIVTFNRKLYEKNSIQRLVQQMNHILGQVLFDPQMSIAAVKVLPDEDRAFILETLCGHGGCERFNQDPVDMIRRQADIHPHRVIAVDDGPHSLNRHVTARRLHDGARALAGKLLEYGVGSDGIVAIFAKRSLEFLVSIAAILEAGGAYLPLDITAPVDRIATILKDSGASVILFQKSPPPDTHIPAIDLSLTGTWEGEPVKNGANSNPAALAYVLYTSGTTGIPKGVMVERRNLCFLMRALDHLVYGKMERPSALALVSPFVFDASIKQTFAALTLSHKLVMVPDDIRLDGGGLWDYYNRHCIDVADGTPVHIGMLRDAAGERKHPLTVNYFLTGGEELPLPLARDFLKLIEARGGDSVILNVYGPTECTVDAASFAFTIDSNLDSRRIPIGKPLPNTRIYILDPQLRPVPVGMAGELWISGAGVGRGYINQPRVTAASFMPDPFCPGLVMYRTGDLGRWLENGDIEFLGRIDSQVKLRGFRIELGEIEHCLRRLEEVKDAVAAIRTLDDGQRHLCAYLVPRNGNLLDMNGVRDHLERLLPYYSIPSFFTEIQSIPLTATGKVNRRALPKPEMDQTEYIPPADELETNLVKIWAAVLGLEEGQIGVTANFFQLGGHSLKATKLVRRVSTDLGTQLPLVEVFKHPSIRQMASYIREHGETAANTSTSAPILLRKHEDRAAQIVLIHDGSGDVDGYLDLYSHQGFRYNVWGIRAPRPEIPAPQNLDLEEIATSYIQNVDQLGLEPPVHLIGWSLGGSVAFEMALQLQKRGDHSGMVLLVDAPGPWSANVEEAGDFSIQSEIQLFHRYFPQMDLRKQVAAGAGIQDVWSAILDIFNHKEIETNDIIRILPTDLQRLIPNIHRLQRRELLEYLNLNRSLARARALYKPRHTLEAPLDFLKAGQSGLDPSREWQSYCKHPIYCNSIDGDHFSIMKHPAVEKIAECVHRRLQEQTT